MAGHAHDAHHPSNPLIGGVDPQFGKATPGKLGMWIFLVTDGMSFSGFLIAYAVLRSKLEWPNPAEHLGIFLSGIATFLLICSSVSMVLAIDACKARNRQAMLNWLLVTICGGAIFLGIQAYEYTHLVHQGITLNSFKHGTSLFGSTFYLITGFHGLHVATGVGYLICEYLNARKGNYDNGDYNRLEILGLFWHFVDLVWILVFTFVYLL
ncbi:cytochrome c oxidase subunit 3 [Peredibacter starrii]|uniref:Cytochrome bo(3) ubiquinol oxidase subunit 3 n=1 Tax=Peredibacter starrii TaxID=28202 RepID=A0AAX4HKV1_9BACT|nr:cytochrome c oxidase subunit 3 [Peredibacter starrii]WPU63812.1 cytochrome c oxidase subunit 3 [Peredibacter starrii]